MWNCTVILFHLLQRLKHKSGVKHFWPSSCWVTAFILLDNCLYCAWMEFLQNSSELILEPLTQKLHLIHWLGSCSSNSSIKLDIIYRSDYSVRKSCTKWASFIVVRNLNIQGETSKIQISCAIVSYTFKAFLSYSVVPPPPANPSPEDFRRSKRQDAQRKGYQEMRESNQK